MSYSTVLKQSGSIDSSEDIPIHYDFYVPIGKADGTVPLILFLHGFKGFKDWGPFPDACEEIARTGFGVVAFNFSLNGVGEGMTEFDELDLFARETLSQDLDDVGRVIEALNTGEITTDKTELNTDEIGILGHSRGGHTAVAAADEYPEIACLVTWSAVADYNQHWSREMIEDWESQGYTVIKNSRTGQDMPVNIVVYQDAQENADRVIALKRVKNLYIPVLFIHAKGDQSVPYQEADKLFHECPSADKEIKIIPDSGHTFGGAHPFEENEFPGTFEHVLEKTIEWFEYYLK